nr:hypothetical protein [uncultured Chitinophaga sp.]
MTVLRYLPVLGLGLLFSVRTTAQQMKLGLQPTLLKKEALLELNSDSQGLLLNRVPKSAINAGGPLFNATDGMFVYVTDPGEKCLYIKANGAWKKVADFSGITTDNIPEGATNLYFTQARARAAFSAGNGINISPIGVISNTGVLTFAGRTPDAAGNIAPAATDYASFYLPWASKLTLTAGTGMKATTTATKDLNTNPSFTIDADNGSAIWNANKLASVPVSATAPAANQVLTFNGTQWEAKAPAGATGNFINNGTSLQTGANFNIDGYGDIGRDVRVGGGVVAATATLASKLTLTSFTAGSVTFIDAAKAVTENNGQFFWDNTKTALGLGTATPKNKLEIAGQAAGLNETAFTSGLRLSNLAAAVPGAANAKLLSINTNGDVIVTQNPLSTRKIKLVAGSGVINFGAAGEQDLSADRTWQISVDSAKNIWNANKIQNKAVATAAPNDGDVLKWNATTQMYTPAEDITGGASYGTLTSRDIRNADAPDERYRMKIWQGIAPSDPGAGVVQYGPAGTTAFAWSVLAFRSGDYTTHLYFDKNTLALREWEGSQKPLAPNTGPPVNPWYKVVTTYGDNSFTTGGLLFGYKTSDASTETAQDAGNLFWDNSNKELGIKTNNPQATLDVNGKFKLGTNGTVVSNIIKTTVYISTTNLGSGSSRIVSSINLPGVKAGDTVILSPSSDMAASLIISWVRAYANDYIKVAFASVGATSNATGTYDVTIIQQ